MTESSIYKSYLYISENQFTLSIFNSENSEKVLEKIFVLEDALNHNKLDELNLFLANNLYDIEKKIGSFIKEIFIIYDSKKFFSINISIKNNNYGEQINNSSLYRPLQIASQECVNTLGKNKIVHMMINKYKIDDKEYSLLPKDLKCNYFSLDIKFICIPIEITKNLEILMKKFHISVKEIISADYLRGFFTEKEKDLDIWALRISNGFNENEIRFNEKVMKNEGFFERFFNFFK
tara:strand:+ start:1824 stop:2528 length:705 start_codon:yes stop_codon:yes gene_type:complete